MRDNASKDTVTGSENTFLAEIKAGTGLNITGGNMIGVSIVANTSGAQYICYKYINDDGEIFETKIPYPAAIQSSYTGTCLSGVYFDDQYLERDQLDNIISQHEELDILLKKIVRIMEDEH